MRFFNRKHLLVKTVLPLLLCLALLFAGAAFAAKSGSPAEIRVLLRRLNLTDSAWLTLEGRYLVRCGSGTELLLPPSARVTVLLRNGRLILFHDGLSLSAGKELLLVRQADGDTEPGIRFNLRQGIYPGDLRLSVKDGVIQPVLTIPLESYLKGVVPCEMSDSFPQEALKAQAVCARTYALSRVDASADWDVVDTTNDQVFRGLVPENKNSIQAVEDTAGLVLTCNNRLITAWYCASNGGQTELPGNVWPGNNVPPCFAMADDPWDAENPESLVRTAVLNRDGSGIPAAFLRLLRAELRKESGLQDFRLDDEAELRVDAVTGVRLTTPRHGESSRLMTRLEITVGVSAPLKPGHTAPGAGEDDLDIRDVLAGEGPTEAPAATPAPTEPAEDAPVSAGTWTVTLDLFPHAVKALGLSISGADNEIVTVTEDDTAFTLKSGRYGHGVGMSQRGAEYQAKKDGRTFDQILSFYFPGASLKRYQGEPAPLPTPDPVLAKTPGPVPTATPRPTLMPVTEDLPEGAWLASVEHIDDDSSLNLRAEPSPVGEILMRLYRHQKLIVLEYAETEGWVHVKTDAAEGYVMDSFLEEVR